jgi:hypothetical protein
MMNYNLSSLLMAFWGLLLVIAITHAQTYKWTDEHGRISFTDDLSRVPEKYGESAVRIGELEKEPKKEWWMEYDKERPI